MCHSAWNSSAAPLLSEVGSGGLRSSGGGIGANRSGDDIGNTHSSFHSRSPVGGRDSAAAGKGNSGGHPVRHRGTPKNVLGKGLGKGGGFGSNGVGAGGGVGGARTNGRGGGGGGGYWTSRQLASDGRMQEGVPFVRSPTR